MTTEAAHQIRREQPMDSGSRSHASSDSDGRVDRDVRGGDMRFASLARSLILSALAASVIALSVPSHAQEVGVDAPTLPTATSTPGNGLNTGHGRGSLLAPSVWLMLNTPVQERIDLKIYGFYIGELGVPVAQIDLPIRASKFLTITPSYMYYRVPASGLNKLTPQPGQFTDSYEEQQFRIDGTFSFAISKLEVSVRNMYVRRFRPTPEDDINRYRGRIAIAYPLAIKGHVWKPFASYEKYYEHIRGWNRHRLWSGVTLPISKRLSVQPSYMWESSDGSRDLHYLLFGMVFNTR